MTGQEGSDWVGSGGVKLHRLQVINSPEMGAALFSSPTSSSNSEAKTDDGSWMEETCQDEQGERQMFSNSRNTKS